MFSVFRKHQCTGQCFLLISYSKNGDLFIHLSMWLLILYSMKISHCRRFYFACRSDVQKPSIKTFFRLLSGCRNFDHITPILCSLHWLLVECRIDFKVLLLTYKALHGKAPVYISSMLSFREGRSSRSSNKPLLSIPCTKYVNFGDHAFSVYTPTLWNTIPYYIRSCDDLDVFKTNIKTYLFQRYFKVCLNRYS